jgi:short-subunit dehydrogenase
MRVLIFGGNGRVAKAMTSLMLARSWQVTSVIRNPSQEKYIQSLGDNQKGTIDVISLDLKDLKDSGEVRQKILDNCSPDCVVFAAGKLTRRPCQVAAIDIFSEHRVLLRRLQH